jgi:hypothetical protein
MPLIMLRRCRSAGSAVVLLAVITSLLLPAMARPARALAGYSNAANADVALRYVGQWGGNACRDAGYPSGNSNGQCRQFATCVVWMASGHALNINGGYYSVYASHGVEVAPAQAVRGDLIQLNNPANRDAYKFGMHTAFVVSPFSGENVDVVDSNFSASNDELVRHHSWNPFNQARTYGLEVHVWRFGQVSGGTQQPFPDGSFVAVRETGRVYRIAGGAPLYVSTWSIYGGAQPTTAISQSQLEALRPVPADGTFIGSAQTGRVYRIAGGAPLYVSTWSIYGGAQPTVAVDQWALDHYDHLNSVPADNTFINGAQTGRVYRIAGGAPLYVSTWSIYGGVQPTTAVDQWALDHYDHLRPVPADNTFINSVQTGRVYRIAGGAPLYVSTWSIYGGAQPTVAVDQWALDHYDHLNSVPADNTFINSVQTGRVYRIAGGAPLYVSTWSIYGGAQPTVAVDQWALDHYDHLNSVPADGTLVVGLPSNSAWVFTAGRRAATSNATGVQIDDYALAQFPTT